MRRIEECTHTTEVPGRWVANRFHSPTEWEAGGFDSGPGEWEEGYDKSTTVDVDLHRYKCTQCDKVLYYSERARQHYEEGVKFPGIRGLE